MALNAAHLNAGVILVVYNLPLASPPLHPSLIGLLASVDIKQQKLTSIRPSLISLMVSVHHDCNTY